MKKSKKVTIISIITIAMIMGLLQIYHYCLNLSVELPEEMDSAVKVGLETMIEPNKYLPETYDDVEFVFSASAHHTFGYTIDNDNIKVYGIFNLMKFDEECIKAYRDNKTQIGEIFHSNFWSGGYFLAYLKRDEQGKIVPEKIWTQYSIDDSILDTLKKFPIKTWPFILIGNPNKYDEIHVKEMQQQLHDYVYDNSIKSRK